MKKAVRTGSILLVIVVGFLAFNNRQYIIDQYEALVYKPPASIVAIEQQVQLTSDGQRIFYATRPSVEDPSTFNQNCQRLEAGNPILGCYTTNDRIYIYNLTNEQLKGMEEVTAVHEMLHAVWQRTSDKDKTSLATSLQAAYAKIDDAQLKERMAYYERTEPGEFANELHSILGTEKASLGEPLESYYAKYFSRQQVLALHQQYNGVYEALYKRADELYALMETLSRTIESESASYQADMNQLEQDIARFNARASAGEFSSGYQFSSERNALIARSNKLETKRLSINNTIEQFNLYNEEYKKISDQIQVLNDSMDSLKQLDAAPKV